MPSKKDPSNIKVGSGRAGKESVPKSSLTFKVDSGVDDWVQADNVLVNEPPDLSGQNAQLLFDGLNSVAPEPRPNMIGQSTVPENDGAVTVTPTPVEDTTYSNGTRSGLGADFIVNTQTITLSGILFPADRGVLAVTVDGVPTSVLNLRAIFVEGEPGSVTKPSRSAGQNDYVADSDARGDVLGFSQGFSLTDRFPALTEYPSGEYDAFDRRHTPYQLAKYEVDVDLGAAGESKFVGIQHFKSYSDFEAWINSDPYEIWVQHTVLSNVFYDSDTTTIPSITSYSFAANDTTQSGTTPGRYLSGVEYYKPSDDYSVSWQAEGMFDDSLLKTGAVQLRWLEREDGPISEFHYSEGWVPDPLSPGGTASYTNATFDVTANPHVELSGEVLTAKPQLLVQDPFGRQDTSNYTDSNLLIHTGPYSGVDPRVENFDNEEARYTFTDVLSGTLMVPDGTGSSWDSEAMIGETELQVRGIPVSHSVPEGMTGGELSWPDTDYSTGHYPTQRWDSNGSSYMAQRDYSSLTMTDDLRTFFRAFDLEGPKTIFKIRLTGNPDTSAGHTTFAESIVSQDEGVIITTLDPNTIIGKVLNQTLSQGGGMLSYEEESKHSVLLECKIDTPPLENGSGLYPLSLGVFISKDKSAATSGDFALYRIEILDR